ncbi:MAG TPA: hypothetical protein VK909_24410, partial [Anaerolineales bacterium]|nr:hypothetical protein [Anaerolineales bacterium]
VMAALEMQVHYIADPERGEILRISCVIPSAEGDIALPPSQKLLPSLCKCWIANPLKSRK